MKEFVDFNNLSNLNKQEVITFIKYLKLKELEEKDINNVGNISFAEFKDIVFTRIDFDETDERKVYEKFSNDGDYYFAHIFIALENPIHDKSIVLYDFSYYKEDGKLKVHRFELWSEMLDTLTRYHNSR